MVSKKSQPITKPVGQWLIALAAAAALSSGAVYLYSFLRVRSTSDSSPQTTQHITPTITAVAALGRLEPKGEIINLSAPASVESARIGRLLIEEGDRVREGQTIAVLDSYSIRLAAVETAKADVETARANLARVKAGAREGDIEAQKARINRLEAELDGQVAAQKATIAALEAELQNATVEFRRYEQLHQDGAISTSELDSRRLRLDTAREQLQEARETLARTRETTQIQKREAQASLESLAEVRPVDVQVAQAELNSAIAAVQQAEAELDLTYIKSPINGQILEVHARSGETVGSEGIVEIGQTDQMYVAAQVYETDIQRVRIGQKATITSTAFSGELQGEVEQIGLQVNQQDAFEVNPLANTDNRVVEVKIRLDPETSQQVAHLSNLQVEVVIHL